MAKLSEILSGPDTWVQGFAHLAEGGRDRYCLLGALALATHGTPILLTGGEVARLRRQIPGGVGVIEFNDATGRTWEEIAAVVEAFDRDRLLNP